MAPLDANRSAKLFLGGLTKTTVTEDLYTTFKPYGNVIDAIVMERNGNQRGFGFVTFSDKASVDAVLAKPPTVDGRVIDIKRAVPEEDIEVPVCKLFVGGLPQSVSKEALKKHFSKYGEVKDSVVMIDRSTGRSRGFGFVRFAQPEAIDAVLAVPQKFGKQIVDCKRAQPAEQLPPPLYPRSRCNSADVTPAVAETTTRRKTKNKRKNGGQEPDETPAEDAKEWDAADWNQWSAFWASIMTMAPPTVPQPAQPVYTDFGMPPSPFMQTTVPPFMPPFGTGYASSVPFAMNPFSAGDAFNTGSPLNPFFPTSPMLPQFPSTDINQPMNALNIDALTEDPPLKTRDLNRQPVTTNEKPFAPTRTPLAELPGLENTNIEQLFRDMAKPSQKDSTGLSVNELVFSNSSDAFKTNAVTGW